VTSLYADFFQSDTLLKIWDNTIFYFMTNDQTSKRRGIWLLMAPALLILALKHEEIENAKSAREVIEIYNEGCGIEYNPNKIISDLTALIDDIFVMEGRKSTESFLFKVTKGRAIGNNNAVDA
jgi:hypothetical protein